MFNWLKKVFGSGEDTVQTQPEKEPNDYKDFKSPVEKVAVEVEEKPKKTETKTAEPKKRGRKKAGITKTDLNKMTKDELEAYAKKEHKVDLDKRRKKADLVEEVLKLAK